MIRPEELKADRDREAIVKAQQLEAVIDEALRARYEGYSRAVTVEYPTNTRRHVVEHVLAKYRQNGWHVKEVDDQRDGNYIQFTHINPDAGDGR